MIKFKNILLIYVLVIYTLSFDISYVYGIDFNTKIKNIENKKSQYENQLNDIKFKKNNIEEEIKNADYQLNIAQKELEEAESNVDYINKSLEQSRENLAEAKKNKDIQLEKFSVRIKFLHERGNIGYLEIILSSKSFNDFLKRREYVKQIMEYDKKLLENLNNIQNTILLETQKIEDNKIQAEKFLVEKQEREQNLKNFMEEKQRVLASYMSDEKKYEELIKNQERESQEIRNLILASASKTTENNSNQNNITYTYTEEKFNWPVPSRSASSSSLSSGFVYRKRPIGSGYEQHTGYDIPASYGADIVAAESGTVIFSGWKSGYGNTIVIDHGGGITTLYGHNSSLVVSVGQFVSRGQVIAKCGSTGNSTGNHCHFEVRSNGSPVSPEGYLGVSNISE